METLTYGKNQEENILNKFGNKLEKRIVKLVSISKKPISIREISLTLNKSWHSVEKYCTHLESNKKITGFVVGKTKLFKRRRDDE